MAVTPDLLNKISFYEKKGYTPDEIVSGIKASGKYSDVVSKMDDYGKQGYSSDEMLAGIRQSAQGEPAGTVLAESPTLNVSKAETERMRNAFINNTGTTMEKVKNVARQAFSPSEAIAPADSVSDWVTRVAPRSITQLAPKIAVGAYEAVKGQTDPITDAVANLDQPITPDYQPAADKMAGNAIDTVKGVATGALSGLGFGMDQDKNVNWSLDNAKAAWTTDPAMAAAGLIPLAKGVRQIPQTYLDTMSDIKGIKGTLYENSRAKFEANKLSGAIDEAYTKAVRPTVAGKKNITQIDNAASTAREAVKAIIDNKDTLGLETSNGLPTNLQEFSRAIKATKDKIYQDYNAMKTAAGSEGVVIDLNPIAAELESITGNKALSDLKPEVANYALKRAETLRKRGTYTPEDMQAAIEIYNADLNAFYKNPSPQYASQAAIDARIVSAMRSVLDDAITGEVGPGYQGLKNQYGALKGVEPEVSARAIVDARKNPAGLLDFTDIMTSGEALSGVLTGNPMLFAKGVAGRGVKEWIKNRNNPNAIVEKMFTTANKYHTPRPMVDIPTPQMNMPQVPTVLDPSTGLQIPARQATDAVSRGVTNTNPSASDTSIAKTYVARKAQFNADKAKRGK